MREALDSFNERLLEKQLHISQTGLLEYNIEREDTKTVFTEEKQV